MFVDSRRILRLRNPGFYSRFWRGVCSSGYRPFWSCPLCVSCPLPPSLSLSYFAPVFIHLHLSQAAPSFFLRTASRRRIQSTIKSPSLSSGAWLHLGPSHSGNQLQEKGCSASAVLGWSRLSAGHGFGEFSCQTLTEHVQWQFSEGHNSAGCGWMFLGKVKDKYQVPAPKHWGASASP